MRQKRLFPTLIPALFLLFTATPSFAHKVRIFAWEDSGRIITESKFSGRRPAKNAAITVVDPATGKELLSGETNPEGMFSFPLPSSGAKELDIIVNGGDGHKNHWRYVVDNASFNTAPPVQETVQQGTPEKSVDGGPEATVATMTRDQLSQLLATTIDRQLAPIKRSLAENSEQDPSLQDILGGIGYILGLFGIAAFIQARKKNKE